MKTRRNMYVQQKVSDQDKAELKRLVRVLKAFHAVQASMPVSRMLLLIEIALEEGLTTTQLAGRTGYSVPVTTRQMLDIGEYDRNHEPGLGSPLDTLEPEWISGYDLACKTDLLIHDCQYTDEEYPEHVGWGHSGMSDALTFASRAGARRLLLFHHDPLHSDGFLDRLAETARHRWAELGGDPALLELGMEGGELEITPAPEPISA